MKWFSNLFKGSSLERMKKEAEEERNKEVVQLRRDVNQLAMMIVTLADATEYNHEEIQAIKSLLTLTEESQLEITGSTVNVIKSHKLN
jgi:uncharacterized membrane protein YgaE (UPF0421/DUF939 family)